MELQRSGCHDLYLDLSGNLAVGRRRRDALSVLITVPP